MRLSASPGGRGHRLAVLLLLSAMVSCEGGGTGPGKVTIGTEGGTASLEKGSVTILISAGALSAETVFTASQSSSYPSSDLVVAGSTYEIGPSGITFEKLVTLTLSYDPAHLPEGVGEVELGLFRAVGDRWELVGGASVDTSANTVTGRVMELGLFGAKGLSVATVEVSPPSYTLEPGRTKTLTGVGRAASGLLLPRRAATWTSSAEDVATVDSSGLVTAVGMGSAAITATIEGRSGSAQIHTWGCSSQSEIPAAECWALVDLYDAVNPLDWRVSREWITSPNPCEWRGVTCEGGSVSTLILNWLQLPGVIPVSLGNLTNLSHLGLSGNRLSGSIPPSLGNLSNLTSLDLSSNDLSGSIPPGLGNLSSLTELDLFGNQLSGTIPSELGNLSNLTRLSLRGNQLSGTIPSELGDLSNLLELNLFDNQLSGAIPLELGGLSGLSSLSLSHNQLSGRIPSVLGNLSNLSGLSLSLNQLSGTIPAELGNLSNLTKLFLDVNQLSGVVPLQVAQLGGLIQAMDGGSTLCRFVSLWSEVTNELSIPDTQEYREADLNGDGKICGLSIG